MNFHFQIRNNNYYSFVEDQSRTKLLIFSSRFTKFLLSFLDVFIYELSLSDSEQQLLFFCWITNHERSFSSSHPGSQKFSCHSNWLYLWTFTFRFGTTIIILLLNDQSRTKLLIFSFRFTKILLSFKLTLFMIFLFQIRSNNYSVIAFVEGLSRRFSLVQIYSLATSSFSGLFCFCHFTSISHSNSLFLFSLVKNAGCCLKASFLSDGMMMICWDPHIFSGWYVVLLIYCWCLLKLCLQTFNVSTIWHMRLREEVECGKSCIMMKK
jgi:hypothetical protein